jgi:transcriptional regulator with XRE-family HTH domain
MNSHNTTRFGRKDAVDLTLGERVIEVARRVGNKKALARLVNVSEVQIYRYINGENVPSVSVLVDMSEAAGVDLTWLATGRGSPEGPATGSGDGQADSQITIDAKFMGRILSRLERHLAEEDRTLDAQTRGEIIAGVYQDVIRAMPDPDARLAMAEAIMAGITRAIGGRRQESPD